MKRPYKTNAMKELSKNSGENIFVGNTLYKGKNPVYQSVFGRLIKIEKGIPWVRITMKKNEEKSIKDS